MRSLTTDAFALTVATPTHPPTPPERASLRIAPSLPCIILNTSTQMSWSGLVLSSEPSPQWIQIRHSWLRRR